MCLHLRLTHNPFPPRTPRTDAVLDKLHLHTIGDLAKWKYVAWAQSLVALAEFETDGTH